MTLKTVLPELSKEGKFQQWFGLMIDKGTWEEIFDTYLQKIQKHYEESKADEDTADADNSTVDGLRANAHPNLAEPLIR